MTKYTSQNFLFCILVTLKREREKDAQIYIQKSNRKRVPELSHKTVQQSRDYHEQIEITRNACSHSCAPPFLLPLVCNTFFTVFALPFQLKWQSTNFEVESNLPFSPGIDSRLKWRFDASLQSTDWQFGQNDNTDCEGGARESPEGKHFAASLAHCHPVSYELAPIFQL